MIARQVALLQKRLERAEATIKRITQIETKPRLIVGGGGGAATIQFTVDSIAIAGTSSPYNGKKVATVTIEVVPCSRSELIGTTAEVVDWSGCVWDLDEADLIGVWGWATEYVAESLESGVDPGTLTPCHWGADDRCCVAADGEEPAPGATLVEIDGGSP